jgi:hypothetical protein
MIDLRPGGEVWCDGKWMVVKSIEVIDQRYLTDEDAAAYTKNDGYLYHMVGETRSAAELNELLPKSAGFSPLAWKQPPTGDAQR